MGALSTPRGAQGQGFPRLNGVPGRRNGRVSRPRTYAELQQQWFRRVMPDVELPDARAESSQQVLRATIDQLQGSLRALEHDAGPAMDAARAGAGAPVTGSQEVAALIDVARTARTVRGPGSQYIEE